MIRRTKDGLVAVADGVDLRDFTPSGRRRCTATKPWDGNRDSAPYGVQHEEASDTSCSACGTDWGSAS